MHVCMYVTCMYMSVHVCEMRMYIGMCVCMYECTYVRMPNGVSMNAYIRDTHVQTRADIYIHTYMGTYIYIGRHTCMNACMHTHIHA